MQKTNLQESIVQNTKNDSLKHDNKLSFSGHETFPFRYTWLPKGVKFTSQYPNLFLMGDALVILGVGKNMVSSIRYWCETLGLIYSPERGYFKVTELGELLFGTNGCDPYLENHGTLWLLHWLLVSQIEKASTWYLAFTRWNKLEFSREQLQEWLWGIVKEANNVRATELTLKRDVDVFIRTYNPDINDVNKPVEDSFDCPLGELGIIQDIGGKTYRFVKGYQPSLPDDIFIYALLDYWASTAMNQSVLPFEQILYNWGSPGAAFKLTENGLVQRLEQLPSWTGIAYDDTAGMKSVIRTSNSLVKPSTALKYHFGLD